MPPTNEVKEGSKWEFYNVLQDLINHQKDILILIEDLMLKQEAATHKEDIIIMAMEGTRDMNENMDIFSNFIDNCALNDLVVQLEGSIFPHNRNRKATWISPDHHRGNQVDHICITEPS